MIGVVVIGDGNNATSFIKYIEKAVGPQELLYGIDLADDDDFDVVRAKVLSLIADWGSDVIVLSEMFGGTPSNIAISLMQEGKIEVICGYNFPLGLSIMMNRDVHSLSETIELAIKDGHSYITLASQVLRNAERSDAALHNNDIEVRKRKFEDTILVCDSIRHQIAGHIQYLHSSTPNDLEQYTRHEHYLSFLQSLLLPLVKLEENLRVIVSSEELDNSVIKQTPVLLDELRFEISRWWENNRSDAVDWCIRFPAIGGAIGLLNSAGATPLLATSAAIAAIGGAKLYKTITGSRSGQKSEK